MLSDNTLKVLEKYILENDPRKWARLQFNTRYINHYIKKPRENPSFVCRLDCTRRRSDSEDPGSLLNEQLFNERGGARSVEQNCLRTHCLC